MSTYDHEGRRNEDREGRRNSAKDNEGGSGLKEVMALLMEKLSDEEFNEFMQRFGGYFGASKGALGADDPAPFRGMQPGGKRFGEDAMRAAIADARSTSYSKFEEHRKSLGLRRIRVLG
ncbi:hypothetical protein SAMN05444159_7590 [Bradyrhizobium lablabi]|uniref:Uncharacterized protein n=1 Tax=Bradyrhizobium lablabi TaxID=722472 RepID=A0A1M7FS73_9BRAD|nr:hypothetical protein [Bradyrhizobium lablabi]SHM06982.1 hypothetical protein SAMN05444159_7590 [Bradyrhizobium lablabi]